ncbi:hypothetical protein V6N11_051608 [Hibiscus sabdariffa]|uniref:Uncharacterized protein n=1 Tax=Hibiscus sabdariffa TaxID=183260 RepID=A0ABR2U7X0_9ROSI
MRVCPRRRLFLQIFILQYDDGDSVAPPQTPLVVAAPPQAQADSLHRVETELNAYHLEWSNNTFGFQDLGGGVGT